MQSRKATRVDKALDQGIQQDVEVESSHNSFTIYILSEQDVPMDIAVQCELHGWYCIENFWDIQTVLNIMNISCSDSMH